MCILLNVKKHEKTFALNVDIFISEEFLKMALAFCLKQGYDRRVSGEKWCKVVSCGCKVEEPVSRKRVKAHVHG